MQAKAYKARSMKHLTDIGYTKNDNLYKINAMRC